MIYSALKNETESPQGTFTNPEQCPYHIPDPKHYAAIDKANMINFSNLYHWRMRYIIHIVACIVCMYFLAAMCVGLYEHFIGFGYFIYLHIIEPLSEVTFIAALFLGLGGWIPLVWGTNLAYFVMNSKLKKDRIKYFESHHKIVFGKYVRCKKVFALPFCSSHRLDGGPSEHNLKIYYLDDTGVERVAYSFVGNESIFQKMAPGTPIPVCYVRVFSKYPLQIAALPWFHENCPRVVEENALDRFESMHRQLAAKVGEMEAEIREMEDQGILSDVYVSEDIEESAGDFNNTVIDSNENVDSNSTLDFDREEEEPFDENDVEFDDMPYHPRTIKTEHVGMYVVEHVNNEDEESSVEESEEDETFKRFQARQKLENANCVSEARLIKWKLIAEQDVLQPVSLLLFVLTLIFFVFTQNKTVQNQMPFIANPVSQYNFLLWSFCGVFVAGYLKYVFTFLEGQKYTNNPKRGKVDYTKAHGIAVSHSLKFLTHRVIQFKRDNYNYIGVVKYRDRDNRLRKAWTHKDNLSFLSTAQEEGLSVSLEIIEIKAFGVIPYRYTIISEYYNEKEEPFKFVGASLYKDYV